MTNVAIHSIELFAGVGMLGEGARAALQYLGIELRTLCYVEREAAAAAQLVTLMEAGILDTAPVWSDVTTFRGQQFRGSVDCIIAGFPCQDLSVAGKRAGLDGKRSGLFFHILDIAEDCGAWFLVLENVSGIASATATVVDEEEGALEERAASRVVGELADRGWCAEWITLSASDVGANQGRERWFCIAWRQLADTDSQRRQQVSGSQSCDEESDEGWSSEHYHQPERDGQDKELELSNRRQLPRKRVHEGSRSEGAGAPDANRASTALANSECSRSQRLRFELANGGASLSHATETGQFSHSSPQDQKTQFGKTSSSDSLGSRPRLNPAFDCWLMGWPCWWTNPGVTRSAKSAMESYRCRLQQQLSLLCDERES